MTAEALLQDAVEETLRPWPRRVLTQETWRDLARQPELALLALWADAARVHALYWDGVAPLPVAVPVQDGAYPALSPFHPAASWFERMVHDLWGHRAEGGLDARPWIDHGHWGVRAPLAPRPVPAGGAPEPPELLPSADPAWDQIGRGPVAGDPFGPIHLRLHMNGDVVAAVEPHGGYAHRGALALMRGQPPRAAARFAARLAGDATVAHALAFAGAAEAALQSAAPPRALGLRAVMLALERTAGQLAMLCQLAESADVQALATLLATHREHLLQATEAAFGHRLMMDGIFPGGVASDLLNPAALARALEELEAALPAIRRGAGPGSRLAAGLAGLGRVPPEKARRLGLPARHAGDAAARAMRRVEDIAGALRLIPTALAALPAGPVATVLPPGSGEGIAVATGARGDCWHVVRIEGGIVTAAFARDPGWAMLPLLEPALVGARLEDVATVLRSLGLSAPGTDL